MNTDLQKAYHDKFISMENWGYTVHYMISRLSYIFC